MGVAGRVLGGLLAMLIGAGPAFGEPSLEERLRQLEEMVQKQGQLLERQQQHIDSQERRIREQDAELQRRAVETAPPIDDPSATVAVEQEAEEKKEDAVDVEVTTGHDGLTVQTTDGAFKFRVGGRLQADFAFIDDDVTEMGSGAYIRRARLKGEGTMWHVWDYKLEADFSDNGVEITDAWLRYSGFDPFTITAGHQKVPFSQQSMTSSNWQVFQERGLPDAFIDDSVTGRRRLGILGQSYGEHWNVAAGFFGDGVQAPSSTGESYGPATRVVLFPIIGEHELLTIGGSIYYRNMASDPGVDFARRPEVDIGTPLANTGMLPNVDQLLLYNAETSTVWGPFHAQAEYTGASAYRDAMSTRDFFGYYVQAGWFLTGESRNYDPESAKYKRIMPNSVVGAGGIGAWEVAARYSYLDLTSGGLRGGRERDVTAGLNWWATPSVLFRLNYVHGWADPNSARTLGGIDEQVSIIEGRAQIVF